MKSINIILVLLLPIFLGCSQKECNKIYNNDYDYDISILYNTVTKESVKNNGKLVIFWQDSFRNDTVSVYMNGCQIYKNVIFTDESMGLADFYSFDRNIEIIHFGLQVNNGAIAYIESDERHSLIGVKYIRNEKLEVCFYNTPPVFE